MVETDLTTIVGVFGASIILIVFVLNQINKLKNDSFLYDFLNLIGSILLMIYAILLTSYPFLILNLVWALVSLKDVVKYFFKHTRRKKLEVNSN